MAKNDPLAEGENVVRYVAEEDYDVGVISGTAFERVEKDHDGLSVNRLGILVADNVEADLIAIRSIMLTRSVPLDPEGCFAQLNVKQIRYIGHQLSVSIDVVESASAGRPREGKLPNPAHASIVGLPYKGNEYAEYASDLLRKSVVRHFPAWIQNN